VLYYRAAGLLSRAAAGEAGSEAWLWLGMLAAELWFGLCWIVAQSVRWRPVRRRAFRDRVAARSDRLALSLLFVNTFSLPTSCALDCLKKKSCALDHSDLVGPVVLLATNMCWRALLVDRSVVALPCHGLNAPVRRQKSCRMSLERGSLVAWPSKERCKIGLVSSPATGVTLQRGCDTLS
jgi:hypothetical protein